MEGILPAIIKLPTAKVIQLSAYSSNLSFGLNSTAVFYSRKA